MISEHNIEIRFADIDAMGHVNNAVYLSYFEQARIKYFADLGGSWDWKSQGILLAKNVVEYYLPILLNDHVVIKTKCIGIGGKSLTFSYLIQRIHRGELQACSKGESVLVCFDSVKGKTIEVPEEWRNAIKVEAPKW